MTVSRKIWFGLIGLFAAAMVVASIPAAAQQQTAVAAVALSQSGSVHAQPLRYAAPFRHPTLPFGQALREQEPSDETQAPAEIPARLHRHVVAYSTRESAGTIIIDTPNTYLYFVLGGGKAVRYGIGVGREGFTWSGVKAIERKAEWPDWIPPAEMLRRQPYLPRFMAGGPGNPLGARAMYIGGTVYRIHGTNAPSTIGKQVSSGCIRMLNEDVIDLYARTNVGTKVVVLPMQASRSRTVATRDLSATGRTVANVARAHSIY
jgi:lipoprotein-anchoring transpeptidase ErfK/SrfK